MELEADFSGELGFSLHESWDAKLSTNKYKLINKNKGGSEEIADL